MFVTILSAVLCWISTDSNPTRAWGDSYFEAVREVKRTDKPLFIVLDRASSPMGKMVVDGPFLSREVDAALEADYVRLFIDTEGESGRKLADQFDAKELPRFVVLDRSGEWQVYRKSGSHSTDEVLNVLARYRRAKLSSSDSTPTVTSSSSSNVILCKT